MKVLFIGGTGNISAASVRLALQRGMEVFILNRGHRILEVDGAKSLIADIHQPDQVKSVMAGLSFDVVANFIAYQPADVERDFEIFAEKTKQYFFISSASAYQKPVVHPVITEETPLENPYWEYSRNKIAAERRVLELWRSKGFPGVIVRPSLTYDTVIPVAIGGWNDFTFIERVRQGLPFVIHGDGTSLWTITHADDFAKGLVGLFGNLNALGEAFHITSDELLNWNQIYSFVCEAAGVEGRGVHVPSDFIVSVDPGQKGSLLGDKAWSVIFDNSKIKRFVPDFKATIGFREGIRRTVRWFEEKPERKTIVPWHNEVIEKLLAAYGHGPRQGE